MRTRFVPPGPLPPGSKLPPTIPNRVPHRGVRGWIGVVHVRRGGSVHSEVSRPSSGEDLELAVGSVAFFVPVFPQLEAWSCEPTGRYIDSGTFDADGMMAATTMPPTSDPAPRGTAAGSSAGKGKPGPNVLHCSKQGPTIQHAATSGGVPPRWPSTPFAEWGRWPRRRNADRTGLRSPVATMMYRMRVP
jgi:hypothetical protein